MTEASEAPEHNYEKHYSLKEGDIFVEGGAWPGRYGIIASRKVGNNGRVILMEPSPINFEALKSNVQELRNVTIVNKALWKDRGQLPFYVKESRSGHRIKPYMEDSKEYFVQVEATWLSDILNTLSIPRVDLLAWDIEGAEMEALQGAHDCFCAKTIKNFALCFYHLPQPFIEAAIAALKWYNYEFLENDRGILYGRLKP